MTEIERYSIHSSGYGNAYEVACTSGDFVMYDDIQTHIVRLKLDFEERLSAAVNDAYDQGYVDGVNK